MYVENNPIEKIKDKLMLDFLITNGVLDDGTQCTALGIKDGKISLIETEMTTPPPARTVIDAGGGMISPPFIDSHFHFENAFMMGSRPNLSTTLGEAIEIFNEDKLKITVPEIMPRAEKTISMALTNGILWSRSHADVDQYCGVNIVECELAVKKAFKDVFDLQVVAFPQYGMADNPEAQDYMWQAMELGADVVGGKGSLEKDMDATARQIELAFEMAAKYDLPVDMHIDETSNPYWHATELLADMTIEKGWQGRVCASHVTAMGFWDEPLRARVIEKIKKADLTVISNPLTLKSNNYPQGRGITSIRELLEAGVNVAIGQDDIRNMFYTLGQMDMMELANIVAHIARITALHEIKMVFDMPRYNAAKALGVKDYGITVGNPANLIVLDATSVIEAIGVHPSVRYVFRKGKLVVENIRRTIPYWKY
jgi:cytosine/creatinine deaminase